MFDVLGCFFVDFGSIGQLGCFRLIQAVLGLFKFALSCVLLFEVLSDLQVGSSCSRLFNVVFICFSFFLNVLGCFRLFAFVLGR